MNHNQQTLPRLSRFQPALIPSFPALFGLIFAVLYAVPAQAAINIMPLGDSITQGGINGAGPAYASYRYRLYYKFTNAGHTVDFVGTFTALHNNATANTAEYPYYNTTFDKNHQADWGKKAVYLDTNLTAWLNALPAGQKPDIAIINIGTNDAAGGTPVATFTTQLNGIIAKLRASNPDITVVISNLMVIPSYATAFNNMNNAIAGVVAAQDTPTSRVVLADIASGLPANARYDGIHPNFVGEEHLATIYFNAVQSVLDPGTAEVVTVDNAQTADVSLIGSWNASTVSPGYFGANYLHDNNTDKGTKAVTFMPPLAGDGDFLIYARWVADPNRATNVPFDIVTASGTSTVTVNQQLNGAAWNLLGYYNLSADTAEVTVRTSGTNGYVIADAVGFVPAYGVTVDNTATNVTTVGNWFASTGSPGYLGTNYVHDGDTGKGTKSFSFKPALPATDSYLVYARWPAEINRATNVPIDIVTASGTSTVTVNQQLNGAAWNLLGHYDFSAATAEVRVRTTGTDGYVIADAVSLLPAVGTTVDNTATNVTTVGDWFASTGTAGYLNTNYVHDGNTGKGTKSFSFKPVLPATDSYLVYARWPAEINRATNVPVDIVTSSGAVTTVTVNQQANSNEWTLLGTYTLAPANAEVKFRNAGTNGYVVADGVLAIQVPVD